MKARLVLGAFVSVTAVIMAIYLSGGAVSPGPLAAALAFVALVPLAAGMSGFGAKGLAGAFRYALSGNGGAGMESLEPTGSDSLEASNAAAVFGLLRKATAGAAVLGFLMVQIMMMYDLRDKDDIRLYLSFSFVPALVGLVLAASVYAPLEYAVASKVNRLTGTAAPADDAGTAASARAGSHAARPVLRVLAGSALCLAVMLACFLSLSIGRLPPFLNPPSCILMLFFPLGNLLAGPGPGGLARAFAALGRRMHAGTSGAEKRQTAAAFSFLCRSILLAGGTAFMTGVVYFFQSLNDRMRYGPTMALALVAVFQAAFLLVCVGLPLKAAAGLDIQDRGAHPLP